MVGAQSRDALWDRRRDVRFRRAMPWIPENLRTAIQKDNLPEAVYFRDSLPGFVVNRLKQHLGENSIDIDVKTRGDAGPTVKRKGENIGDWLRGCLDDMDGRGVKDAKVREHQAADGLGVLKLDFLRDFIPPERESEQGDADYDDLVDDARKKWGIPVALSAPDPRSLYWVDIQDRPEHVVEVLNKPLVEVANTWTPEGFRLSLGDKGMLRQDYLIGANLPPAPTPAEYGRMVRVIIITDDEWCYHCCYPNTIPAGTSMFTEPFGDGNSTPDQRGLILLAKYPNPLKRPPYFFAAGRLTAEENPAYKYEPLSLEMLDSAEYTNSWVTMQTILSTLEALKPTGIRARDPARANENAAPAHMAGLWSPGFLDIKDREIVPIPSPETKQFELLINDIKSREQQFNLSIMGALQSGTVGKSAPAWTVMQFNEEQTGMIAEAQSHRANMYREMLRSVVYLAQNKYCQDGPVYARAIKKGGRTKDFEGDTEMLMGLKTEDFNIPWRLEINIQAMSQSQRAANTEYFRDLHTEGTLSDQSYWEAIGIEDIGQEQARKDREFLMAPLRKAALALGQQIGANKFFQIHGNVALPILQAVGLPPPVALGEQAGQAPQEQSAPPPEQPNSPGAPQELPTAPVSPGQGMGLQIPGPPQPRNFVAPGVGASP